MIYDDELLSTKDLHVLRKSEIYVKSILRQNTPNISDFQKMILILKRFKDLIYECLVCLMALVNDGIDNNSLHRDFNNDCTL